MNKIALANALKSVFGNSVTTASYFPTCADAAGTPGGVISAANLASVLGGVTLNISANTDLDALQSFGTYNCAGSSITATLQHRPSDLIEAFMMYVLPGIRTQIIITTWGGFKLYKRTYNTSNNTWYKWQKVTGTEVEYAV